MDLVAFVYSKNPQKEQSFTILSLKDHMRGKVLPFLDAPIPVTENYS
jgi:hypothetical protein